MKNQIQYVSTNRTISGWLDSLSFIDALMMGIAPDGGLFMPISIPIISKNEILDLKGCSYNEIAFRVLRKFLQYEIDDHNLFDIVTDAYDFSIPIEHVTKQLYIVRLDEGPTASFKDFAARFMARAMQYVNVNRKQYIILVATSGDTGSAIGHAYKGLEGFQIVILYPKDEVSPMQKRQLNSIGGNVRSISVNGKFDDCQRLVKQAFTDPKLDSLNLISANSINVGRLLPQIVYYFYSYINSVEVFNPVVFSVPSGNFGNSLGCELARRMGLPVEKIVIAVNENDEFPNFLRSGSYEKVSPSRTCLSNAMNVGNPSNLARYFHLYDGILDANGTMIKKPNLVKMREVFQSFSITDEETIRTIKYYYENFHVVLEPHGAVGVAALEKLRDEGCQTLGICLETASPEKFPEILSEAIDITIDSTYLITETRADQTLSDSLDNNYAQFKTYLKEKFSDGMD